MSDSGDKDSKTEEATQKRLEQSIEDGNAPVAREAAIAAALCASWLALVLFVGHAVAETSHLLGLVLQQVGSISVENVGDTSALLVSLARALGAAWLPALLTIGAGGALASLAQSKTLFSAKKLRPDFSRLSLSKGLARLLSTSNLIEFSKSLFKLGVVTLLAFLVARRQWPGMMDLQSTDIVGLPRAIIVVLGQLLASVAIAVILIAAVDIFVTRFDWQRSLRMTVQEVREEMKESEGDPGIAARRKAIARSRIRTRLAIAVPRATVVIANPTHYAIALRYVPADGGAPIVVAKGTDFVALTIRTMAESQGIPVVENKALARTMHDRVKVEQQIPAEFYRAVADVLIVLQRRGKPRKP